MRLELGSFPVREVAFGPRTRYADGRVEVNRDEVVRAVLNDVRIRKVELEIAHPGESVLRQASKTRSTTRAIVSAGAPRCARAMPANMHMASATKAIGMNR